MIVKSLKEYQQMQELFNAQTTLPNIFPTGEELDRMEAEEMTLEKYLALPKSEQKKWWVEANPNAEIITLQHPETGELSYIIPIGFTPVSPDILDRIY